MGANLYFLLDEKKPICQVKECLAVYEKTVLIHTLLEKVPPRLGLLFCS